LSIEDEDLLWKFKRLSFAASFRWVFRLSPGKNGAEHEPFGEGTFGGFPRVYLPLGLPLPGRVFAKSPGSDEGLTELEKEQLGK
jgi:hypothetical protein